MKKLLFIIIIGLILNPLFASDRTAELEYMYKTVSQIHPDIYTNISKEKLDANFEELLIKADDLRNIDYAIAISEFLATIKDGHTYCSFSEELYDEMLFLPIRLYDDGENVTIFSAIDINLVGKTITSINGNSIDNVIEKLEILFSADTAVYRRMNAVTNLIVTDFLAYAGIVDNPEKIVIISFSDGSTVSIIPISREDYISTEMKYNIIAIAPTLQINGYYSLRIYDKEVYYLPYNSCASNPYFPVDDFINEVKSYISQNPPKALIIDLRNNGGGDSRLLNPFIAWLKEAVSIYNFTLYVFIGAQTFSSAVLNAEYILTIDGAISVGSKTGGSANHFGEVKQFFLPSSGIGITVSSKLFGDKEKIGEGIIPNITLTNTYDDYVTGHDKVYEYVISEIRK